MGHLGPAKWSPQGVFTHNPGSWLKQPLLCPEGFSEFLGAAEGLGMDSPWKPGALGYPQLLEGMLS